MCCWCCISRWSLPASPTQVMAAVRDGPWRSLSSGKKVALAACISVGATVGYLVYRHIRSSSGKQHVNIFFWLCMLFLWLLPFMLCVVMSWWNCKQWIQHWRSSVFLLHSTSQKQRRVCNISSAWCVPIYCEMPGQLYGHSKWHWCLSDLDRFTWVLVQFMICDMREQAVL